MASYKRISNAILEGKEHYFYEATVSLNKKAVSLFLKKIEEYLTGDTPLTYNEDKTVKGGGNPLNNSLIANIEEIRGATLQSFWQEPELAFPDSGVEVWWEVWLTINPLNKFQNPINDIVPALQNANVQISNRVLKFPEHCIYLLKGTPENLSEILYSDNLSELRKPREVADYFTNLDHKEQAEWVHELISRVDNLAELNNISVCLLDTGVNRTHNLLKNLIPERHLDTMNPAWGKADSYGHGTPMAGLVLYGDLTDAFDYNGRIQINHHLESIKFINLNDPHEPDNYGAVTQEAIARAEVINPENKRIVCMAVTCKDIIHHGRPSSWSAAVDQTMFGTVENPNNKLLIVVSSGNLPFEERINYPIINADFSIQDPAQSYNVITVGAYTLKDFIDQIAFPNAEIMASRGSMSPCNTTSIGWLHEWCKKPDIVMEGGNNALQYENLIEPESLLLLSTSKGGVGRSSLTTFNDTSASTALASKFAAELYAAYPNLKPETIRALIIHSADWTTEMLRYRSINQLSPLDKEKLLAHVGYGVPNMEKAKYSANNSLSMIIERSLTPFKIEKSNIKTNEFHLFDLPWPIEALQQLLGTNVRFKITLSYFIEPNPGNKKYQLSASYKSHGLRFKMISPVESIDSFMGRISKTLQQEDYVNDSGDSWIIGSKLRDKGSIHKDIWEGTAADLATRNKIAVYPVGGWWKNRKKLNRYNNSVNYSLIMTIETPSEDVDLFTPVENLILVDS